ncbi:MAG: hypothetical protein ACYDBJ_09235, partial [Aggregatilineales bacterium]
VNGSGKAAFGDVVLLTQRLLYCVNVGKRQEKMPLFSFSVARSAIRANAPSLRNREGARGWGYIAALIARLR